MEFVNLVCANCGGTDFQKLSDLEYRCNHCRGLLVSTAKAEPIPPAPSPAPARGPTIPPNFFIVAIGAALAIILLIVVMAALVQKKPGTNPPNPPPRSGPLPYNVATPPPAKAAKLKTEVIGKVKGSFGDVYIKCMVTNEGETVIKEPSVTLTLYKKDVKLGNVYGDAGLKYLKPGEKTPVWVALNDNDDYTTAEVQQNNTLRGVNNSDKLFPTLKYPETVMKIETGNSSYNDQIYREKFFTVTGTVQNDIADSMSAELFVIYYDAKSQVVGVMSTHPPDLKRGEKAKFEVSAGETQLFGVPVKYEILAVDPKGGGTCIANMIC